MEKPELTSDWPLRSGHHWQMVWGKPYHPDTKWVCANCSCSVNPCDSSSYEKVDVGNRRLFSCKREVCIEHVKKHHKPWFPTFRSIAKVKLDEILTLSFDFMIHRHITAKNLFVYEDFPSYTLDSNYKNFVHLPGFCCSTCGLRQILYAETPIILASPNDSTLVQTLNEVVGARIATALGKKPYISYYNEEAQRLYLLCSGECYDTFKILPLPVEGYTQ